MKFVQTGIEGLLVMEPRIFEDARGRFIKTFHKGTFVDEKLETEFVESYYSISQKGVIRGMHFQTPPHHHAKLVYVPNGSVTDVVLDIRKNSPTYGKSVAVELSAINGKTLYIPKGLAHGFKSHEDGTNVTYLQTSMYAPDSDAGIHYDSFGFDWGSDEPVMSNRDLAFEGFETFDSPFEYGVNS